jgi:hypothetical protein
LNPRFLKQSIRAEAAALEKHPKLARNFEHEQRAAGIRIHAELRCGEILKKREKAKGAIEPGTKRGKATRSDDRTTSKLADLGITKNQSSEWQRMAKDPGRGGRHPFMGADEV